MTCDACTHSQGSPLQCGITDAPAVARCDKFVYEPGTDSEEFRLACEVRYVLALPSTDVRPDYLAGVRRKRGDAGADMLEAAVKLALESRR